MRHLAIGMYAGIGASGAGETHGFGGDAAQGALEHLLQSRHGRLRLPAGVGAAVVLDAYGDPHATAAEPVARLALTRHAKRDFPGWA